MSIIDMHCHFLEKCFLTKIQSYKVQFLVIYVMLMRSVETVQWRRYRKMVLIFHWIFFKNYSFFHFSCLI